jgi:hypothetical protein
VINLTETDFVREYVGLGVVAPLYQKEKSYAIHHGSRSPAWVETANGGNIIA